MGADALCVRVGVRVCARPRHAKAACEEPSRRGWWSLRLTGRAAAGGPCPAARASAPSPGEDDIWCFEFSSGAHKVSPEMPERGDLLAAGLWRRGRTCSPPCDAREGRMCSEGLPHGRRYT